MLYNAFSLDGDYVMDYTEEDYTSESVPEMTKSASAVKGAIPGYFEDMTAKFQRTNFYGKIRVNPEYGAQHYPITGVAPDMALPNVYGTFFYFRKFNLETLADGVTIAFPQVHIATAVWLNGRFLGRHIGYSTHFEIEVPKDALQLGENELCIARVHLAPARCRGALLVRPYHCRRARGKDRQGAFCLGGSGRRYRSPFG